MSSAKPTVRGRPATSAAPKSPHTEENQGYRRGRAIRSCLECRRRKMRCNRSRPCQNCNRFCRECIYLPFPEWPSGAPINAKGEAVSQSPTQAGGRAIPSLDSNQYSRRVQTSLFTQTNHAYDSETLVKHVALYDVDADDQNSDLGLQVGRLSITEKLNSFFRSHVASQVSISYYLGERPFPLMPRAPGERPQFSVNMRLCRLQHFSHRFITARPLTTLRIPTAYLQRMLSPPNASYPLSLHQAFWEQFRNLSSLSPGWSSQVTKSSVCFTTNTGPL